MKFQILMMTNKLLKMIKKKMINKQKKKNRLQIMFKVILLKNKLNVDLFILGS